MGQHEQKHEWQHQFHAGQHHHHHGHHHHGHHHWGRGMGRGLMFFPPFALIFGFFMLFLIFKTGLWLPLILIGAFFFFVRPMMMGRRGWGSMGGGDWSAMRDKMKNQWGSWRSDESNTTESASDKPKRGGDNIEYV